MSQRHHVVEYTFYTSNIGRAPEPVAHHLISCSNCFSKKESWLYVLVRYYKGQPVEKLYEAYQAEFGATATADIVRRLNLVRQRVRSHNSRSRPQYGHLHASKAARPPLPPPKPKVPVKPRVRAPIERSVRMSAPRMPPPVKPTPVAPGSDAPLAKKKPPPRAKKAEPTPSTPALQRSASAPLVARKSNRVPRAKKQHTPIANVKNAGAKKTKPRRRAATPINPPNMVTDMLMRPDSLPARFFSKASTDDELVVEISSSESESDGHVDLAPVPDTFQFNDDGVPVWAFQPIKTKQTDKKGKRGREEDEEQLESTKKGKKEKGEVGVWELPFEAIWDTTTDSSQAVPLLRKQQLDEMGIVPVTVSETSSFTPVASSLVPQIRRASVGSMDSLRLLADVTPTPPSIVEHEKSSQRKLAIKLPPLAGLVEDTEEEIDVVGVDDGQVPGPLADMEIQDVGSPVVLVNVEEVTQPKSDATTTGIFKEKIAQEKLKELNEDEGKKMLPVPMVESDGMMVEKDDVVPEMIANLYFPLSETTFDPQADKSLYPKHIPGTTSVHRLQLTQGVLVPRPDAVHIKPSPASETSNLTEHIEGKKQGVDQGMNKDAQWARIPSRLTAFYNLLQVADAARQESQTV